MHGEPLALCTGALRRRAAREVPPLFPSLRCAAKAGSRASDAGRDGRAGLAPRGLLLRPSEPPEACGLRPRPAAARLRGRALRASWRGRYSRAAFSRLIPSSCGPHPLGSAPWRVGTARCAFNGGGCAAGWGGAEPPPRADGAVGHGVPARREGPAGEQLTRPATARPGAGSPEMEKALRLGE